MKKMPWIREVSLAPVDESSVIPTVLYYESKKPLAGRQARERCPSPELLIEDFKLELGSVDPDAITKRSISLNATPRRTPVGLAKDFFDEALKQIDKWIQIQGFAVPTRILIAEPLSLGSGGLADEAWLSNYRRSILRALYGRFKEIDFMPEPFAVFQYYRYGAEHPLMREHRKYVALILDFGGGTFDVSVVETTKEGDISGSGVNSRPLGAKSIPVGGFYVNRMIAEEFLFTYLDRRNDKGDVRKALERFYEHKNADDDFILSLSEKNIAFFRNYKRFLHEIEGAKVSVCRSIANWSLAADLTGLAPYPLKVPINPFSQVTDYANTRLDAGKLRKLFEEKIWNARLREAIDTTLTRAHADLRGQEISVILLSGGSSNIRWQKTLLERDILKKMPDAQILELNEDFLEIVAKGLATECARRYHTEGQGDFRAVTYNRLCLVLRPDDEDVGNRPYRPVTEELRKRTAGEGTYEDGVLLPTAISLRGLKGESLRWKTRLSKPPRHHLSYYFLRSSFDPEDTASLQNVEETKVNTPRNVNFDRNIEVQLTVREDSTAEPRFVYSQNSGTGVNGRAFYLDMTFAADEVGGESYLGFDFGSSTSACSFVHSSNIQLLEAQSRSPGWRDLSDLVGELPYPCAAPLARFMSEMDKERRMHRGREAAEALLSIIAYTSFMEGCSRSRQPSSYFKGFAHRSAGPLWALSKQCLRQLDRGALFSAPLVALLNSDTQQRMDAWVAEIPNTKHRSIVNIDWVSFLRDLGNHVAKTFSSTIFGAFEGVTAKKFSKGRFLGILRDLRGPSQTFIRVLEYEGAVAFSEADVFAVDSSHGSALPLSPLYFWGLDRTNEDFDLYELDNITQREFSYKAVQPREATSVTEHGEFEEIWWALSGMRDQDPKPEIIEGLSFQHADSDP